VTLIATYAVPLSILAVFGVLLAGLWSMLRGDNPNLSQTLMRWRVGLQFVAVIIIMAAFYLKRGF
jgi:Hypoxia induced protein conserved region